MPRKPPVGRRFQKGQSGNPGGRPKYKEISHAIRHILTLDDDQLANYKPDTVAERLALVRIQQAIKKGGLFDAQYITDRAEGKATATVKSQIDLQGAHVVVDILKPPSEEPGEPED